MNIIHVYLLLPVFLILPGCSNMLQADEVDTVFNYSDISLMPEGEPRDFSLFGPLHPTVVAWGNDPIGYGMDQGRFKAYIQAYREMGIKLIASNVWMLTATERYMHLHPEFQSAVCYDIAGEPIVPGWLDSEYNGIRPWWGCTNHPLYRSLIRERAAIGIRGGANMLHLDDHMGTCAAALHSGGCFCEYCMQGFNQWMKNQYSNVELDSLGIDDQDSFDFATMVREAGFFTRSGYISGGFAGTVPLFNEFIAFQREAAATLVRELGDMVDSIAGKKIPVGVNSWNLDPSQLATSHYADYFSNEVQHYNMEDLVPPFVYLLGNALGKPVFSTGTGEDWIQILQNENPVRVARWIATAYAFGNYFMYSYNKWGFSEETGTLWYQIPVETFEPFFSFIHENRELFDGFEAFRQVAVLYDNEDFRLRDKGARDICRTLHYANIPTGLVVRGDVWLKADLTVKELLPYDYLILPKKTTLTDELKILIKPFAENEKLIRVSEETDPVKLITSPLQIRGAQKIWTLPRVKHRIGQTDEIVIHLLNQDYQEETDQMNKKENFEVSINNSIIGNIKKPRVSYYSPGGTIVHPHFSMEKDQMTVRIPVLDIWGILKLE
ncbi:MAG: hypothetical protein WD578_00630 [Bacteroidales bacterium]